MTTDLSLRLAALEERVAALEERRGDPHASSGGDPRGPDPDTFWALTSLRARLPEQGGVLFTGSVRLPTGEHVEWQQSAETESLLEQDWSTAAPALDALSHPVRLLVLHAVLGGTRSTAELAALEPLGTAGQLHHHLRPLVAAGWLRTTGRGRYEVPATRVVALLAVLTAVGPA
ncbi:helix-turn-helix transcriptional regulator [Actinotalea sp. K2]|uniref:ArsR/SmtB family transcription factor n=1 Tax=Actinotalea sp. K2 TaxID=2939438 RepID=UPI002017B094|nr:helix-turn-helix domain-containing protein [Actinotalea sp. K2]MCL3862566.1 helix-turn-helix domain-containing protein [Actinotalea sp. K2]